MFEGFFHITYFGLVWVRNISNISTHFIEDTFSAEVHVLVLVEGGDSGLTFLGAFGSRTELTLSLVHQ